MIYWQLFLAFLQIGMFSFGGGYAALPLIQEQVMKNGWLSATEFTDLILIMFQFFIIIVLKLKIFSFQICMKPIRKVGGKTHTSNIGYQAGDNTWPDKIGFILRSKINTAE